MISQYNTRALIFQLLAAVILGAAIGYALPGWSAHLTLLGAAFIRLAQMTAAPLIFSLTAIGVYQIQQAGSFSTLTLKIIICFVFFSLIIMAIGLAIAIITQVGSHMQLPSQFPLIPAFATSNAPMWQQLLPNSIIQAFAENNLLGIVSVAILFGCCMAAIPEQAKPVVDGLQALSTIMIKMVTIIVRLAPWATVGYVAYAVSQFSWSTFLGMATLIGVFFLATLVIILVLFPLLAAGFKVKYWQLLGRIWDLMLLCFLTRSSEIALAPLSKRLVELGVRSELIGFVLPIGYVFNLCGIMLYQAIMVIFIMHLAGVAPLSLIQWGQLLITMLVISKGVTGIPSAGIIGMLALVRILHLPEHMISLLLSVEFIIDMPRTVMNMLGNALLTMILNSWHRTKIAKLTVS